MFYIILTLTERPDAPTDWIWTDLIGAAMTWLLLMSLTISETVVKLLKTLMKTIKKIDM